MWSSLRRLFNKRLMTNEICRLFENATFKKSSWSAAGHDNCVEVARTDGYVAVRDSKDRAGTLLVFTAQRWEEFLVGIRNREFG